MNPTRIALALLVALAPNLRAQNLLATEFELKDGGIVDTAAHQNATSNPSGKRLWLAQGRVRAALELQDASRMAGEDRCFVGGQVLALTSAPSSGWEVVQQVELDEPNAKLYTLTEGKLYREDVSNPAAPTWETTLNLQTAIGTSAVQGMRVWSAAQTVIILTTNKIITVKGAGSSMSVLGSTPEAVPFVDLANCIAPKQVSVLDRMVVAEDTDGRVIAYVLGQAVAYPGGRPAPRVLVLCDLGAPTFTQPTFDNDPSVGINFVFFDPADVSGGCFQSQPTPHDWGARDVAVLRETVSGQPKQRVFLACGVLGQVQRLDATAAWTQGITRLTPQIDVDPPNGPYPGLALQRVLVHPTDPGKLVVISLEGRMWLVDRATGVKHDSSPEIFRAIPGDVAAVVRTGNQPTVWATPGGNTDYQVKAIDVTQPPLTGMPLQLVLERFWPHHSDGGVAIPEWESIYLLTFGGVVRYYKSGSDWVPDLSSLQPASTGEGGGPNAPGITEHIFLMRDVKAAGDHRLYVANGGGFFEFSLDAAHNPLPPVYVGRPPLNAISSSWINNESNYGNDVAIARVGTELWALADVALLRDPPTSSEAALLAYRYNTSSGAWEYKLAAVFATAADGDIDPYTDVIHVSNDATPVAFVNYPHGFVSIPLGTLAGGNPSLAVASNVDVYANGSGFRLCKAITSRRERVFVCMSRAATPGALVNAQINMYPYSATTGAVGTLLQSLTDRDIHCQSNGAIGASNMSSPPAGCSTAPPLATIDRMWRARYHATSATCGAVYVCGEPFLLELAYTSGVLSYSGHWLGDYTHQIQDAYRYDFGSGNRLLMVKDSESFALVVPSTLSCP